ncbi:structural maintenance of chromosomes protein 1B-like [Copidosoma floridanum]|uniref:structural maintenance of chromosomes protein 1B-like n=1 Tax=Copidosoma floridanum TaxID=29053 RepID=UPI0006C97DC3|nr:structural maintenance of chromosomes protein 1B-like [Copidosoma floridanum]
MANTARLLTLRAEKHELLRECKIKNLKIPLYDGTIDKILLKSGVDTTVRDGTDSSTTDETLEISLLKEKDVEINYAILPESVKNNTKKIVENLEDEMSDILKELNEKFEHINARTDLETVDLKLKKIQKDFNDNMEELSVMRKKFDQVKSARSSLFKEFLTALQAKVDTVFKEIFDNESAQAYIMMRNPDEPYLQGIDFSCIMPNKPMIPMENISGAEKAICALSLLIGIHQ